MVSQTVIAKKLNLSQRTVSLCLAGSDKVADETRRRVLEMANDLGYRPNRSALAMRSGRFNAIALLQSNHKTFSYLPEDLLAGIQDGITQLRMHLVLASVPDEQLVDAEFLPTVLREWSVDGFLVNYNYGFSPRIVETIESNSLPSVWLNTKRPYDCVYPDDIGAARSVTEHLLKLGHRKIAFFSHRPFGEHFSVDDRYAGYEAAMKSAGLAPRKLFHPDPEWRDAANGLRYLHGVLNSPDRPTAVVSYEAFEAMRLILVAFQLGLTVPADLSVTTFNERSALSGGFPVSTMIIPEAEMGRQALDLLIRRIDGNQDRLPARVIPFESMSGGSDGPPKV